MTAQEFVAKLRRRFAGSPISQHEALLVIGIALHDLADSIYSLRLVDGQRLNDGIDCASMCRELVAVIDAQEMTGRGSRSPGVCHSCGHPHASGEECGVDMGGAGICGCKAEVPAA